MIRPQAILVFILVAGVLLWGARSATADKVRGVATQEPLPGTSIAANRMLPSAQGAEQASPTATAKAITVPDPLEPTSTVVPSPTSTSPPEPTAEPVATERPAPPDTGLDGTSLIVERGDTGRLEVAFTFDAGEGAGHTEEILDLLAEHGIKGSFGVTGQWVEQNPELTRRIVADGHMLINHTYDHSSFTGVSRDLDPLPEVERLNQIETTRQIILEIAGYDTAPYFRFPYGDYDRESLDQLARVGYDYTLWWSCDTQGWNGFSPETIAEICGPEADEGGPGAILLMHVADDNDFAALPVLIEQYQEAGYTFVTVEELIQP